MQNLQKLRRLDISSNNFTSLSSVVYTLSSLQMLDISSNESLTSLDPAILKLTELYSLGGYGCDALISPPLRVCQRGAYDVKKYFTNLKPPT